jgi:DNA-binding MarR family transcriptional regulator
MDYSALASQMFTKIFDAQREIKRSKLLGAAHGEMFILSYIAGGGRAVSPGEMSAATDTSTAHVAMALRSLESKGFIERKTDTADRRRTLVTITERGKTFYNSKRELMRSQMERVFMELGEADALELMRLIDRVLDITRNTKINACQKERNI